MRRLLFFGVLLFAVVVLPSHEVRGIDSDKRGLTATPLRSQAEVVAGQTTRGSFIVANFSADPMTVTVSVERFAVKDGTYEYEFDSPKNGWVQFTDDKKIVLQPREERKVSYDIVVPGNAPSGGYYYALLASMDVPGSGVSSELRVASLLYLTVDGGALLRSSKLLGVSAPMFIMEPRFSYKYEVQNTGNVHFSVTNHGKVKDLLAERSGTEGSYMLMPGTTRTIRESIALPVLPGVYTLEYGFRDEQGMMTTKTATTVYVPPWSIAASLALVFFIFIVSSRVKSRRQKTA